ncbi:hypothetical protein LSAT2_030054, partial [Lamellibrachia satsuma]
LVTGLGQNKNEVVHFYEFVRAASAVCKRVAGRLNINGARPVREHSSQRDTLDWQHCRRNQTTKSSHKLHSVNIGLLTR